MYIIELILKNTPMPLSVQRKSAEEADTVYQQILTAMRSESNQLLELTCDRQPDKRVSVFGNQIAAVQVYQKSGTASSGRPPGFFAVGE
jgi:hypothetical protein